MKHLYALFLSGALLAAGATAQPDGDAARRDVQAAMQKYTDLFKTGPVDAVVACYAPDGELLEPGMAALHGRDAIKAFLTPLFAAVEVQAVEMTTDSIEVHDSAAYQWGTYSQRAAEHGKPAAAHHGRYVAAWRREADGQWRIARLMVQPFPQGAP
jgi:uncharacterized protein (TIGR02246 family)